MLATKHSTAGNLAKALFRAKLSLIQNQTAILFLLWIDY